MTQEHPVTKGNRTEARVLAALLDRYDTVLLPYGGNCRYDLAVDTTGGFIRIQCKTGRLRKGTIRFNACSSTSHHLNGARRAYHGEADIFGVYCPELQKVYLVPVDNCGTTDVWLRVDPPKNNQKSGIRMASDFELT